MKNTFRTGTAIFLVCIYCLAAGAVRVNALHAGAALKNDLHSERDVFLSVASINLFCPVTQPKNTLNASSQITSPAAQYAFSFHSATAQATERLLQQALARYDFDYKGLPIRSRKANLIFPFHYFW